MKTQSARSKSSKSKKSEEPEFQLEDSIESKPKRETKSKRSKSTSEKQSSDKPKKQFSPTIIINFFNNYFRNLDSEYSDKFLKYQHITFKSYSNKLKKEPRNVIDLNDYLGLVAFVESYKQAIIDNPNVTMEDVVDMTMDIKLRSFLSLVDTFKLNKFTEEFDKYIISQLKFQPTRDITIETYIKAIDEFFANEDKIKTKIYNTEFPHGTHNNAKNQSGVNIIYLQHISRYHDEVLKLFIEDGLEPEDILARIQLKFAKEYTGAELGIENQKERNQVRLEIQKQLVNKQIIPNILNALNEPNSKRKNYAVEGKWIKELDAQGISQTRKVNKQEIAAIKELVRELSIVNAFLKILKGGQEAAPEVDLKECLDKYNAIFKSIIKFREEHKNVENSYKGFIKYLVESVRFIKNIFNYKYPLKTLINDSKNKVQFKFNKKLRYAIAELINVDKINEEALDQLVEEFEPDWKFINSPKTYDIHDMNIYAKIGKYVNLNFTKDYRIGIGCAIVLYIQEQLELIRVANARKKDLIVYVKCE